jgi:hypothetical protein
VRWPALRYFATRRRQAVAQSFEGFGGLELFVCQLTSPPIFLRPTLMREKSKLKLARARVVAWEPDASAALMLMGVVIASA